MHTLSSKVHQKRKCIAIFQDGRSWQFLKFKLRARKWAIISPFLMKFGTQTKTDMLSSTITKAEVYGKKICKT
jgi:hypothetical protein